MHCMIAKSILIVIIFSAQFDIDLAAKENQLLLQPSGEYRNLLLTLPNNLPEDWTIIDNIKKLLQSFSQHLFKATQKLKKSNRVGLRLGEARILIPRSWGKQLQKVDRIATWERRSNAHVFFLNLPTPQLQSLPMASTMQQAGCGQPGKFIFMRLDALNSSTAGSDDFDYLGKLLLREFASLRWGVFREDVSADGKPFYSNDGEIFPTTCSKKIVGDYRHKRTKALCNFKTDAATDCHFVPQRISGVAAASLMAAPKIPAVQYFCSNQRDELQLRHNELANNLHNKFCDSQSVADVIHKHQDLKQEIAEQSSGDDGMVKVLVVRPQVHFRVVLVLDKSGSMNGASINNLKRTVVQLIDKFKSNTQLSIIAFNDNVDIISNGADLDSSGVRNQLKANVKRNIRATGGTYIGPAMMKALQILRVNTNNPSKSDTGVIILLSDGQESGSTPITLQSAAAVAARTSIIIHSIAFGDNADKGMAKASNETGGVDCFAPTSSAGQNGLMECIDQMISNEWNGAARPVQLFSKAVPPNFYIKIKIDSSAKRDAKFLLMVSKSSLSQSHDLRVTSPSGVVYGKGAKGAVYVRDNSLGFVRIEIKGELETGEWIITDPTSAAAVKNSRMRRSTNSDGSFATLYVETKSAELQDPLSLTGEVSHSQVSVNSGTRLVVYGRVVKDELPQPGAKILARVESGDGLRAVFPLHDNGAEPDMQANDGIHSGYVPLQNISESLEYTVQLVSEQPVNRVARIGRFSVKDVEHDSLQNLPPATVHDLSSVLHPKSATAVLRWTAVGDKLSDGAAASYQIKMSLNRSELIKNPESAHSLPIEVKPRKSGDTQNVTISAQHLGPYSKSTVYIGLLAVNAKGIKSNLSNVIDLLLEIPYTAAYTGAESNNAAAVTAVQLLMHWCLLFNVALLICNYCF